MSIRYPLLITQGEKHALMIALSLKEVKGCAIKTVHESQGLIYENVIVVRSKQKAIQLFESTELSVGLNVAMTFPNRAVALASSGVFHSIVPLTKFNSRAISHPMAVSVPNILGVF